MARGRGEGAGEDSKCGEGNVYGLTTEGRAARIRSALVPIVEEKEKGKRKRRNALYGGSEKMATKTQRIKLLKRVRKSERMMSGTPLWQLEKFARDARSMNAAIVCLIMCGLSNVEAREIAAYVRK